MANENQNSDFAKKGDILELRLYFPIKGFNRATSYVDQQLITTPLCSNIRLVDVAEERSRGGQRPGLDKAYTTQVSGASHPVLVMTSIVSTYLEAET